VVMSKEVREIAEGSREHRREMVDMLRELVSGGDRPRGAAVTQVAWWGYWETLHMSMRTACHSALHMHHVQALELRARMSAECPHMRPMVAELFEKMRTRDLSRLLRTLRELGEEPEDATAFTAWITGRLAVCEAMVERLGVHRKVWDGPSVRGRARAQSLIRAHVKAAEEEDGAEVEP
jgi:hypothetical protein